MTEFRPDLTTTLPIGPNIYGFLPHPILSDEVNKIVRDPATIYQVMNLTYKTLWALKVPNAGYRDPHIADITAVLMQYRQIPGFLAANRLCLTKATHSELIATYPDLEYAVLMPWISGKTWAGFMDDPVASVNYSSSQARELALTTAQVLWNLEAHHLAHTDIAGDNVMVLDFKRVELLDIEGLYVEGMPLPVQYSKGWRGYQHPHLDSRGQWRPDGDRFAGAILLTEMLTWWRPLVRALTEGDSLFQLQEKEPREALEHRLKVVRGTLRSISPSLQALFDQAWYSSDLAQCPDFSTWTMCLLQVQK